MNRRKFLQGTLATSAIAGLSACSVVGTHDSRSAAEKWPAVHGKSVMGLVAAKMETVRIGLIGVGERGSGFVEHFCNIEGAEIVAICDIDQIVLDRALKIITDHGKSGVITYTGDDYAYRKMLERKDIDIVVIATPWRWHTSMSVDTMESGKHAFVEVPAAVTVEEAWQLVNTSERTQKNCMMMENVCYGREELMVLNMVRQGLFGELLHGEAAYIHELRWQMKEIERKTGSWRTAWHSRHNGNLYPTHGLGPVSQYMNINRGDRFDYINSMSSPAIGRSQYAQEEFPSDHGRNQLDYVCGDMNTSLIKTVRGRTIMIQHDTTTPRPYTRHNLIQGTNGVFAGYPNRIALEEGAFSKEQGGTGSFHRWDYGMDKWFAKYEHPLYKRMGEEAKRNGGHGGIDFLMCWRFIYCLRNGEPLDQNVYDAASWSVIMPLSFDSVSDRSNSKEVPDFTRGLWEMTDPLGVVK